MQMFSNPIKGDSDEASYVIIVMHPVSFDEEFFLMGRLRSDEL